MKENMIAKILFIIGIVNIVLGFIIGLVGAAEDQVVYDAFGMGRVQSGFNFTYFISWATGGFVTGMLFIGFSEIIKLLHVINWKTPMPQQVSNKENLLKETTSPSNKTVQTSVDWTLGETEVEKIKEKYAEYHILDIIPSNVEGYCVVRLQTGAEEFVHVVDINGFGVVEVKDAGIKKTIISWYNDLQK
ncbi:hypothetical protein GMD78_11030 [Ornithinibacillus sp. L9]|uniref:Uncharacterized protein n=1 Tax=Ornithinibacillus caprae TaxID=2678566 RepID=A0A6N8FLR2_9BACI|nr:hypothetical protein [Ornithinibacillus caprae]MUK88927.1 hypothetical protein [Ornithinibacillus caprae]